MLELIRKAYIQSIVPRKTVGINYWTLSYPASPSFKHYFLGFPVDITFSTILYYSLLGFIWFPLKNIVTLLTEFPIILLSKLASKFLFFILGQKIPHLFKPLLQPLVFLLMAIWGVITLARFLIRAMLSPLAMLGKIVITTQDDAVTKVVLFFSIMSIMILHGVFLGACTLFFPYVMTYVLSLLSVNLSYLLLFVVGLSLTIYFYTHCMSIAERREAVMNDDDNNANIVNNQPDPTYLKFADFDPNIAICPLSGDSLGGESIRVIKGSDGKYYNLEKLCLAKNEGQRPELAYNNEDEVPGCLKRKFDPQWECPISAVGWDELTDNDRVVRTIYGNYFSKKSLDDWLATKNVCPITRGYLDSDYYKVLAIKPVNNRSTSSASIKNNRIDVDLRMNDSISNREMSLTFFRQKPSDSNDSPPEFPMFEFR